MTQNTQFGSVNPVDLGQSNTKSVTRKTTDPKLTQNKPKRVTQTSKNKPSEIAKKWLLDHPEHKLSVRDAALSANVSFGTMQRAMKDQG